jgi:prevent-host-death family protein
MFIEPFMLSLARQVNMKIVNIHEAKTTLSQLLESVLAGEDVVISKAGTPLARLIPYHVQKKPRSPGIWKGKVIIADDFDDPLPLYSEVTFPP